MSTTRPPTADLHIVVGYDGSPPAGRALDAAGGLLRGRTGRIEVVYVAHISSTAMLSAGAVAELNTSMTGQHPPTLTLVWLDRLSVTTWIGPRGLARRSW